MNDRVKEIEELLANATHGDWSAEWIAECVRHGDRNCDFYCEADKTHPGRQCIDGGTGDGEFIAASKTAIRYLLDELKKREWVPGTTMYRIEGGSGIHLLEGVTVHNLSRRPISVTIFPEPPTQEKP